MAESHAPGRPNYSASRTDLTIIFEFLFAYTIWLALLVLCAINIKYPTSGVTSSFVSKDSSKYTIIRK